MDFLDLNALSEVTNACGNSLVDLLDHLSYSVSEVIALLRETCQNIIDYGLSGI